MMFMVVFQCSVSLKQILLIVYQLIISHPPKSLYLLKFYPLFFITIDGFFMLALLISQNIPLFEKYSSLEIMDQLLSYLNMFFSVF